MLCQYVSRGRIQVLFEANNVVRSEGDIGFGATGIPAGDAPVTTKFQLVMGFQA